MAQLGGQSSNAKPLEHCNDSVDVQQLKDGSLFVSASALKFEGNWKINPTFAELLDSCTFKVSGEYELQGNNYMGHFVVGLKHNHTMGKVKIETSSPKQESEEDLTNQTAGLMKHLAIGFCGDDHVQISLTSTAEPCWKMHKGLIIYGVSFTHVVVVTGKVAIKKKISELLKNAKFPLGVMPVDEVVELGHNPSTGFLWAIRKKKLEHFFKGINRKATLDTEVTGFLEERRMKKITGIKAKELMIWVSLTDFRIDDPASGKIIFTATAGITKTFPVSAFEEEEEKVEVKKVEEKVVEPVKEEVVVKKMEEAKKEVEVKN